MMKNYKKILLWVLSVNVMILMVGCKKNTSQDAKNVIMEETLSWQEQYDLSIRYLEEGDYEAAVLAFTKAIEIDAKQAVIYVGRGDAYVLSGETEENLSLALADYEMAVSLDARCAEAYLGLADVYIRQGDYEKALELLKTGLEKTGNEEIENKIKAMESGNIADSQNRDRQCLRYDESGVLVCREEYTYDEKGLTSVSSYNGAGEQLSYVDILYDEQGRCIQDYQRSRSDYETVFCKVTNEYDDVGNTVKRSNFNEDGWLRGYETYERDVNGNVTRVNCYGYQGQPELHLYEYEIYEYDANGNYRKISYYDADDTLSGYQNYEYDDEGNMIRRDQYDGTGSPVSYEIYEYDTSGNCTKETKWHCDLGFSYYGYEYDTEGNLIRTNYRDDTGVEYTEEY